MNQETKRIILASILITAVAYFYPTWWYNSTESNVINESKQIIEFNEPIKKDKIILTNNYSVQPKIINVQNKLYNATISNHAGGTFLETHIVEKNNDYYKYLSNTIENLGFPVILKPLNNNYCNPCLGYYDNDSNEYSYINEPFTLLTSNSQSDYYLDEQDSLILEFQYIAKNGLEINKSVVFYGNSYQTKHNYQLNNNSLLNNIELIWDGGLAPIEKDDIDILASNAAIGQSGEIETMIIDGKNSQVLRQEYLGDTNWASVRTKYFIAALMSDKNADYATMSGETVNYLDSAAPLYNIGIGYNQHSEINASLYLGPLDIDHISLLNNNLDKTINFGFAIIRPIGKFVLWFLKLLHNSLHLNYGICLIIFAIIIQFITSPLTKKTYKSSQKMQEIQPLVKKIQEKYKDNAQKMNQEVMKTYKEHGVNPLGGCMPLLLQMPLLMAIFSVFRDTIEFRGTGFFWWITDLSQPDILFHLPFHIPLYGDHVAFLPILMGISIFLTQRLSMATMDPAQKPMMYGMNAFFILIFNGFPSGLNLYYTVYNLLNYFQQKTIRSKK